MSELRRADSVVMGNAARVYIRAPSGAVRSRRLLRLAGDDRLVAQIRRGSEAAFEVAFERHAPAILGFCRHMLGSLEEAEDAVQHTFAAAYRDLQRGGDREIALKPWLFTIARNRCLSVLRARREQPIDEHEAPTAGLVEQVEQRAELRQLLADVRELPDEQRAALLLAEVGGLPQADIAAVLGCEAGRVKALVYRARSALVARRDARDVPCEQIREQLANLRGGSLRRTELRLHLRECSGCREFREQVRRQRQMLSVALPVAPSLGLKSSVLAAVGIGGGAAVGGGGAAVGGGGALAGVAKVAAVAALGIGTVAGGTAVVVHQSTSDAVVNGSGEGVAPAPAGGQPGVEGNGDGAASNGVATPVAPPREHSHRGLTSPDQSGKRPTHAGTGPPGQLKAKHGQGHGAQPVHGKPDQARGRGPVRAPPQDTPVRRGPPESKAKTQRAKPAPKVVPPPKADPARPGAAKQGAAKQGPKLK